MGVAFGLPLACRRNDKVTRATPPTFLLSADPPADLIFLGGSILTMDDARPRAEALAVRGGAIVAVGTNAEVLARKGSSTTVVDLGGKTLMPGFVEPHAHPLASATTADWVDAGIIFGDSRTIRQALDKIRAAVAKAKPGAWVRAKLLDPSLQSAGKAELTTHDLDPIAPHNPLFILNASGHLAYVNSRALAAAGLTRTSKDPAHGRYKRDARGNLIGVLEETPAFEPFLKAMPRPSAAQLERSVRATLDRAAAAGCTSVNDAGVGLATGTKDIELLERVMRGGPPVRMTGFLVSNLENEWTKMGIKPGHGDDNLRFIGMKFWSDGSNQGRTGYLREPYFHSKERGKPNYSPEQLTERMQRAHDAGWQLAVHANGDAAIDMTLAAYEAILEKTPRTDHRHRIEHCSLAHPEHIAKLKALGISPSFLIGHVYYWGRAFRDDILGRERAKRYDPTADAVNAGLRWSMHSDYDVTPMAPLRYVENAVTRVMRDGGEVLGPEQRVPIEAALKAVTIDAAYQCQRDHLVGSLTVGKRADLVVLEKDPTTVPPASLRSLKVLETWIDGDRRFAV